MSEMMWRPIETAPKDGTRVLLYWPSYAYDEGDDGEPLIDIGWYTENPRGPWRYFTNTGEQDCYGLADSSHQPTHWMPLPPSPPDMEKMK
jgi:hypothetical protein